LHIKVLGAAAGGGFPQWNCRCDNCRRARAGDPAVKPRTQASLAVSADGKRWVLLNASPDLPAQLRATPALQPADGSTLRGAPIEAVVLSGGDIDCLAGLLSLREGHRFNIYAPPFIERILRANQVFAVLDQKYVKFQSVTEGDTIGLQDVAGASLGLSIETFSVPGKIPLYQEEGRDLGDLLSAQALWRDDEMIVAGVGTKTGARMGHVSLSGREGSLAAFSDAKIRRKIYIHINNTNPILCDDSSEAEMVRANGWDIAWDGMEITI
jgi:pyrroloquinoline quinone biosynthesis protein B